MRGKCKHPKMELPHMRHLPVSAPSFGLCLGLILMLSGAPWWLTVSGLLLGAPFFVAVCYVVCTVIQPCDQAARHPRR